MINIIKKPRKLLTALAIIAVASLTLAGIQSAVVNVTAALHPIMFVSPETGLEFGLSFPQEQRTAEFIVVGKNWHETIYYGITLERKPLPDGYEGNGEDPDMLGYYRNLCPYLEAVSEDDPQEPDTMQMASVDPKGLGPDNLDYWLLKFDVPTIKGFVDQGFIGTPVDGPGDYGCDINIQFIHPCLPEEELVVNGSFEQPQVDGQLDWDIFLSSEVNGWDAEWVQIEPPYGGENQPLEAYIELHNGVEDWVPPADGGDQYAELDSDWNDHVGDLNNEPASSLIYQDIYTNPGYQYNIKFNFSPRPDTDLANNSLEFSWDGVLKDTINRAGSSTTDWSQHEYTFTATDWITRLQFADAGTSDSLGTFIDKVSVRCIPIGECTPGQQSFCDTGQPGSCSSGTKVCDENGNWGDCQPEVGNPEYCQNGIDDDCDGLTDSEDPDCHECQEGEDQPCQTGQSGICAQGIQYCDAGMWGICIPNQTPTAESCNGLDDDCDGSVDEGDVCSQGECGNDIYEPDNNEECDNGEANRDNMSPVWDFNQGVGNRTYCSTNCQIYEVLGTWCGDEVVQEQYEECDTTAPEGYTCTASCTLEVVGPQCSDYDGDGYSPEGGDCGDEDCDDDDYDVNPGVTEDCDNGIDDDCDGYTDLNDSDCNQYECNSGEQQPCSTGQQGICAEGTQTCVEGFWGSCQQNQSATAEVCNEKDDDCDGQVDDGISCGGGGGGGGLLPLYIHHVSLSLGTTPGSVDVTWFTNRAANSRVVYDTASHPDPTNPPNYGYSFSTGTFNTAPKVTYHTVTVSGLSAGTPYYFRPVSAASPEVFGEEFILIIGEEPPAEEPPAEEPPAEEPPAEEPPAEEPPAQPPVTPPTTEPEGEVLGEAFEEPTTTKDVVDEETSEQPADLVIAPQEGEDEDQTNLNWLWWLLLLIIIIIFFLFWRRKKDKDKE